MEFNLDIFVLSNSIEEHPVKNEKASYKIKYLKVLEFFICNL